MPNAHYPQTLKTCKTDLTWTAPRCAIILIDKVQHPIFKNPKISSVYSQVPDIVRDVGILADYNP